MVGSGFKNNDVYITHMDTYYTLKAYVILKLTFRYYKINKRGGWNKTVAGR